MLHCNSFRLNLKHANQPPEMPLFCKTGVELEMRRENGIWVALVDAERLPVCRRHKTFACRKRFHWGQFGNTSCLRGPNGVADISHDFLWLSPPG